MDVGARENSGHSPPPTTSAQDPWQLRASQSGTAQTPWSEMVANLLEAHQEGRALGFIGLGARPSTAFGLGPI
jgi:hypothetical protein